MSRARVIAAVGLTALLASARAHAQREERARLETTVVLDGSQSMSETDPDLLARVAARLFVDLLADEDAVSVVQFGTTAQSLGREQVRDEAARARIHQAIDSATREEWCTDYRVGLEAALDPFARPATPGERRLVIFLTDGLYDPDRSNESYYATDEARTALERARRDDEFPQRPCARTFNYLAEHVEEPFLTQIEGVRERLAVSGVRLYVVGLGPELAESASDEAQRSRALLGRLSTSTGGALLATRSSAELPTFFASIYSALVGAPVEAPMEADPASNSISFDVVRGARRVAVVVDASSAPDLEVTLFGPQGGRVAARESRYDVPEGNLRPGYRLLAVDAPRPGRYEIRRLAGSARLRVQVIQEVGLRLGLDGVAPVIPEGAAQSLTVGLRSSALEPLRLSPGFLGHVRFELSVLDATGRELQLLELSPNDQGEASCTIPPLAPGQYDIAARALHDQGLLDVAPERRSEQVLHQIEIEIEQVELAFDTMAEEGAELAPSLRIALASSSSLPVDQEFVADWSGVTNVGDLVVSPERFTLGPSTRSVEVHVRLRDPRAMRRIDRSYRGRVGVRAAAPQLFRGEASWEPLGVEGHVRPWTLARYYAEYWPWVWGAAACVLVLLWLLGRLAASKWPRRAKLCYIDLSDPSRSETAILLARRSRSRLPFRSDRHRCGRGGAPGRGGKMRYCDFVAAGKGFKVIPGDAAVAYDRDGAPIAMRSPFQGRWEERYRLSDKYEVWLTRS